MIKLTISFLSLLVFCGCSQTSRVITESYRYNQLRSIEKLILVQEESKFTYLTEERDTISSIEYGDSYLNFNGVLCPLIFDSIVSVNGISYSLRSYNYDNQELFDDEFDIIFSEKYGIVAEIGVQFNAGYNTYYRNNNTRLVDFLKESR